MKRGIKNLIPYFFCGIFVGFLLLLTPIIGTSSLIVENEDQDYATSELSTHASNNRHVTNHSQRIFSLDLPQDFRVIMFLVVFAFISFLNLKPVSVEKLYYSYARAPPLFFMQPKNYKINLKTCLKKQYLSQGYCSLWPSPAQHLL